MKKLATLFTDSWNEFHQVRTITTAAMFGAISVVLGYFTIAIGDYIKIGFSTICNQFVYYLFGPVVGGFFGGALDVLKFLIKPTGAFFPGFTIGAMIGGVLYGCFFYKKPITLPRVLAAEFTVRCAMFFWEPCGSVCFTEKDFWHFCQCGYLKTWSCGL